MKHDARAEEGVLFQLKTRGPQTAAQVARRLGVTAMAVRQHIYRLQVESLVEFSDERRKVGRPARVWRLTSAAAERFPDTHGDLTVEIIGAVRATFGEAGMDKLLRERTRRQIEEYRARLRPAGTSIAKRAQALAEIRREQGYMAECARMPDGSMLFAREPLPDAARPHRTARAYAAKIVAVPRRAGRQGAGRTHRSHPGGRAPLRVSHHCR